MTGVVLFAGGGLACHGLREAGLQLELGVEWDAEAVKVANATGLHHVIEGDVRAPELRSSVHGPGLLWSSFPCQAWSTAGKRQGAKDERNGWPWTVDWIDQVQPRWVIAENVRGLTFHRKASGCKRGKFPKPQECPRCYLDGVILPQLRERYAWAEYRVLDSADFGTPQHRRRLFIVAGFGPIAWPAPTHSEHGDMLTKRWASMGEALGLAYRCWIESRWPGPSPTVVTVEEKGTRACRSTGWSFNGGPDRASDALALGTGYTESKGQSGRRRLTPAECRILMNAPEIYDEALTLVSKTAAYRILGNGVDRRMSRLLAEAVMHAEQGL